MARYFFNVFNGSGLVEDEEGQDLPSLSAAREVAIEGVRSILRDDISYGFIDFAGRVEVLGPDRRALATIAFREAVEVRGLAGVGG